MQPHPFLPPVGSVFHGHYEVRRCLRAGGMGAIYEVVDRRTARKRALKVLLPSLVGDPEMRERFQLEAKVTANLPSEHLVEVLDAGVDGESGAPFLVMELLRGRDVRDELSARGALPAAEAREILRQVASGLEKAHAVGVVHRDLKPENVFLAEREGRGPLVKILDFGVAKVVAESTTAAKTTRSVGTPLYMAPEQIEGDGRIDARADVYAFGQLAFTLLTGEPYFAPETRGGAVYSVLLRVMRGGLESASTRAARLGSELPPGFDGWFAEATALLPHERFASIIEAMGALEAALDQRPAARPELPLATTERGLSSNVPAHDDSTRNHPGSPLWIAAAVAASLALAAAATARAPRPGPAPPAQQAVAREPEPQRPALAEIRASEPAASPPEAAEAASGPPSARPPARSAPPGARAKGAASAKGPRRVAGAKASDAHDPTDER